MACTVLLEAPSTRAAAMPALRNADLLALHYRVVQAHAPLRAPGQRPADPGYRPHQTAPCTPQFCRRVKQRHWLEGFEHGDLPAIGGLLGRSRAAITWSATHRRWSRGSLLTVNSDCIADRRLPPVWPSRLQQSTTCRRLVGEVVQAVIKATSNRLQLV